MGFWKKFETDDPRVAQEVEKLLLPGEQIEALYALITDYAAITNQRVLFVEKEFHSSEQVISSITFRCISSVSLQKGGFMKFAKTVYVQAGGGRHSVSFMSGENAHAFYCALMQKMV
ncbi:MAG TPA: PH domain-containing protein [Saprospiraceae bacterium]|nr:PH domain-containing protein [Saprospiraceae bacterium]HMP14442.1 PH domain-containing protein [Saprospiraceae bacterium]